jgi:hypothetical protein
MSTETAHFDLLVDQRHFYFIAVRDLAGYRLADYWAQIGSVTTVRGQTDVVCPGLEIQHRQLRSELAYPRGKPLEIVSVSKDGSPPYLYDVFAIRLRFHAKTYFVFVFPFAALAREIVDRLIITYNLRRRCDLLRVDLPLLIQHSELPSEVKQVRTNIVGLQVTVPDDPALSSLSLGGDNPMKSSIYRSFLQEPIRKGTTILEQCILACELQLSGENPDQLAVDQRKSRARVHLDAFGNFKFYLHINGENLITVPYLIQRLISLDCLDTVSINPLHRVEKEDE